MTQRRAQADINRLMTAYDDGHVTRRVFLGSLTALAMVPQMHAQAGPPIPVRSINHMTLSVSDPARSLEWCQGLFGLPIAARQANTVVLRLGDGPQFVAIGGGSSNNPRINHLCLSVNDFDENRLVRILGEYGFASSQTSGPMKVRIRMRGEEFGGAPDGTPELYFGDPDGVVIQFQVTTYCGGAGVLGDRCLAPPESAPSRGLLTEMIHETRVIPLDGRPHLPGSIRQWLGDSRGYWEEGTLVVETTNFTDKASFTGLPYLRGGSGQDMSLIERFTRVNADRLVYEFTVMDPDAWTRPWTAVIPMKRTDSPIFEYACHEGNYAMVNILAGARAREEAARQPAR